MIDIQIPKSLLDRANEKAKKLGKLNNSITSGEGNLAGYLGEYAVGYLLWSKDQKIEIVSNDSYDYDLILNGNVYIDVKTKRTTVVPKEYYECSVAKFNTKQKCDKYAFVRVNEDYSIAWVLGWIDKEKYFQKARSLKKGQIDGSNRFVVKADCFNLEIKDLESIK